MLKNTDEIVATREKIQTEIDALCGGPWKEGWSETHAQFNEMVFFILLYEDAKLGTAEELFCSVVAPYAKAIRPLKVEVAYHKFIDGRLFYLKSIDETEVSLVAFETDGLGAYCVPTSDDGTDCYRSTNSERERTLWG